MDFQGMMFAIKRWMRLNAAMRRYHRLCPCVYVRRDPHFPDCVEGRNDEGITVFRNDVTDFYEDLRLREGGEKNG